MPKYPTTIRLCRAGSILSITWPGGETVTLPAALLRERARDALSVRKAVDGQPVTADASLTITRVEPVGNYAVRLGFSDGHDRGIFPWAYLSELAASGAGASERCVPADAAQP